MTLDQFYNPASRIDLNMPVGSKGSIFFSVSLISAIPHAWRRGGLR
jgi:hypothetical protein